ncbi:MAG TPA: aminomethyl-transferring glycine dehydrogenase subunit GcvPA [Steroidobacteraceae bacterium]|nr:aminomethyl-transferring glycine dehydrogenase subunit GcvPA [Steroidobacteraceae bacterium]
MAFIPHTAEDVRAMLATIGVSDIEQLFDEIPAGLRAGELHGIPPAASEMEVGRLMSARAVADGNPLNFIGAGAYEHHIPAAVWAITTRGEIYTAYTPYQAEASQGTLQTIYEYQTMIASLTGMQVSNASLYDGASALAEACLMAVRAHRRSKSSRILMPRAVNPTYRKCASAIAGNQNLAFENVGFDARSGQTSMDALARWPGEDVTALVIQQPNFFGVLEDVDALTDWGHRHGALVIAVVNPTSLAILKPPGEWGEQGVDIVVGEGQPLGVPLASGGPYVGFMTTRMEHVRQMPGRIVGRTVDLDGRPGYTLTLQAREQHIRRSKATSNICTNQGLLMTATTIYLALMGPQGLARVATASMARTAELVAALGSVKGVETVFSGARFHEALLRLDQPLGPVLEQLARRGIAGGFDASADYPELGNALLVCATETKTSEDIAAYAAALGETLRAARAA